MCNECLTLNGYKSNICVMLVSVRITHDAVYFTERYNAEVGKRLAIWKKNK